MANLWSHARLDYDLFFDTNGLNEIEKGWASLSAGFGLIATDQG